MNEINDFEVILTNEIRPQQAPEGWIVFNAPRPLYGTLIDDRARVWTNPKGPTGYHFAAVDPQDDWGTDWINFNRRARAVIVEYTTTLEAQNE
ncbi:MAG: hypothetical protein ACYSUC_11735 [Planctomycetota bacterium]|jgi:hypothetical protein